MSAGVFAKPHPLHNVTTVEHYDTSGSSRESSRVSSRRASPSPPSEKSPLKEQGSRKLSFPWSLKKSDSQCSLDHGHKHGWKPVTLSPTVLILFATISLILIAIIEFLAQWTQLHGGLALAATPEDFPTYVNFSYQFLPTILAVLYSLFWSWVDLDAKRMQPWFELSRPSGATAENSISLSYPYDFVGFVPFKAFKNRHWPVFCAGTSMVVIFLLLTPLQSTILASRAIHQNVTAGMIATSQLLPVSEQAEILDQSILNEAYAITWLNQPQPNFTHDGSVMPFEPSRDFLPARSVSFTGETTRYWTDLECWPANITRHSIASRREFHFDNGRGCNVTDVNAYGGFTDNPFKMFHFGYQDSPWVDRSLSSPNCSANASHQYLIGWTRHSLESPMDDIRIDEIDITAMFCETSYYKQKIQVDAMIDGTISSGESITDLGPRQRMSPSEFNITAFEYLLGAGVSSVELEVQREFPFGQLLEQYPRTVGLGLTWPASPMVGFAIGALGTTDLEDFRDPANMEKAFRQTHQMMFSLAMRRVMANDADGRTFEGTVHLSMHGVVANRVLSAVVEGLLGFIALCSLTLAYLCQKAPSNLSSDPASLGSLIDICQRSSKLLSKMSGFGCLTEEELPKAFSGQSFKLRCGCQSQSGQMSIDLVGDEKADHSLGELGIEGQDPLSARALYKPVQPWVLRRWFGALVLLVIIGACVLLAHLKMQEKLQNGFRPPNVDFIVEQILFAFLPTVFATAFEPLWVLVNRLLCILQPFKDLWHGQKTAKGSINARYTSVPPQLVFWRAATARHYLLVAVCLVALLSNLLAVGLSGLFERRPIETEYGQSFEQTHLPIFNNSVLFDTNFLPRAFGAQSYAEPFYVAMNNASRGTPLPPWIDKEYYFLPVALPNFYETTFTVQTTGIGILPSCSSLGNFRSFGEGPVMNITLTRGNEVLSDCPTSFQSEYLALNDRPNGVPSGPSAAEVVDTAISGWEMQPCSKALILGWSRSTETLESDGTIESSFLYCDPEISTATFNVTVDADGYILNRTRVSDIRHSLDYQNSTNHTESLVVMLNNLMKHTNLRPWHNNTLSLDWMSYLLKIQPGNEDILDPDASLPKAEDMIPSVESVYALLFALTLGLNQGVLERRGDPITVPGTRTQSETRIFMPLAAFIISMTVLGLNVLTAAVLYTRGVKAFLPRMPTTIGSILAYIAPSRAVREYAPRGAHALRPATFSFGRYIGDDGRAHIGIELDPHVVPVKLASLRNGNTLPRSSTFDRLVRRKDSSRGGDTWL